MNFAKFLRAPFLQNTSGRLLLYKCNAIIDESHKAKKITSNFDIKIKHIVNKYTAAGFPSRFVHSIIDNFDSGKDSLIISQWLFDEKKAFTTHLPFSPSNESFVKTLASYIILQMKNVNLMLFRTQEKCSHCFR